MPAHVTILTLLYLVLLDYGVGSNRMLQGPPIQVVGVALITEFCVHNYSFVEVIFKPGPVQTFTNLGKSDI